MRLSTDGDIGFEVVIGKEHVVFIGPTLLGDEREDKLFLLTNF